MRRLMLAAALALAGGAAHAADNGIYLGAGVSQAQVDGVAEDFGVEDLSDFELDETTWKIIAGFRPLEFLAVEANYMDLGNERFSAGPLEAEADAKAIAAFGLLFLPIPIVDVYAKLGIARWELDGSLRDVSLGDFDFDDDGTEFAYGAGVQLGIGSLAARLEYERFDIDNTDGLELLTFGVTYTFF